MKRKSCIGLIEDGSGNPVLNLIGNKAAVMAEAGRFALEHWNEMPEDEKIPKSAKAAAQRFFDVNSPHGYALEIIDGVEADEYESLVKFEVLREKLVNKRAKADSQARAQKNENALDSAGF